MVVSFIGITLHCKFIKVSIEDSDISLSTILFFLFFFLFFFFLGNLEIWTLYYLSMGKYLNTFFQYSSAFVPCRCKSCWYLPIHQIYCCTSASSSVKLLQSCSNCRRILTVLFKTSPLVWQKGVLKIHLLTPYILTCYKSTDKKLSLVIPKATIANVFNMELELYDLEWSWMSNVFFL